MESNQLPTWKKILQNPQLMERYDLREAIIDGIRTFFKSADFREVDTPLLVQHPGTEPFLEVFETSLNFENSRNKKAFLITSPELQMKKLLAAQFGNIFQITKSFRNGEGGGTHHAPEFSILEWYRVNADYTNIMDDCEQLFLYLLKVTERFNQKKSHRSSNRSAKNVHSDDQNPNTTISFQGKYYDLATPWERISVAEAFSRFSQVNEHQLHDEEELIRVAEKKGYNFSDQRSWESAYHQLFLNEIEPHLGVTHPTILYDYPMSQAALSKKKQADPRYAERFEFYIAGLELGNAFSELTDAEEQRTRMVTELRERENSGKVSYSIDEDFIDALRVGVPNTGGIAVGVDRLLQLFADVPSIHDIMLFPPSEIFHQ